MSLDITPQKVILVKYQFNYFPAKIELLHLFMAYEYRNGQEKNLANFEQEPSGICRTIRLIRPRRGKKV